MSTNSQSPLQLSHEEFLASLPYEATTTNLQGVYSNPELPSNFDSHAATQHDLTHHGLMFRKPTTDQPHKLFTKLLSEKYRAVVPVSVPHLGVTHNYKGKARATKTANTTNWLGHVWAGAGQNTQTYTGVIGTWTIPTVSVPPEAQGIEGGWHSSSWVGIDGMFTSNDVLQGGVDQRIAANGTASYFAWYEWFVPDSEPGLPHYIFETAIPNFPVAPGDSITCYCYYNAHVSGNIIMMNHTNKSYFNITLAPPAPANMPSPATFNGSSVEWIMEAPDGGENTSSLPRFTPVSFTDCLACVANGTQITPANCDTLNVDNQAGQVLTSSTTSGNSVTINFIG